MDLRSATVHQSDSNLPKLPTDLSSLSPSAVDSVIVERASLALKLGILHMCLMYSSLDSARVLSSLMWALLAGLALSLSLWIVDQACGLYSREFQSSSANSMPRSRS